MTRFKRESYGRVPSILSPWFVVDAWLGACRLAEVQRLTFAQHFTSLTCKDVFGSILQRVTYIKVKLGVV